MSARRAGLSDAKRALLEQRLRREPLAVERTRIQPRAAGADTPLSYAQERLWFMDQLAPGNPFYNVVCPLRLHAALDAAVLQRALDALAARHEVLRTTFPAVGGRPVQRVAAALRVPLEVHDLRELPEREERAQRLAAAQAQLPFELAAGPLVRAALIRLGAADELLVLALHHIVCDGWSTSAVLLKELSELYSAYELGIEPRLPELPIQYADFAAWQRRWLAGEMLERQLGYWRDRLADLPVLDLPTDRPRPAVPTFRGAEEEVAMPAWLTDALRALGRREGCTLFMVLLAAFQVLLARYSGQDDIVVGAPVAGRTRPETEGLVGFFVNTLVLRGDLSADPSFRALLARTREAALGAYAHQDVPFELLVEALQPDRDLSRNPLFQVGFALQNAPSGNGAAPGATGGPAALSPDRGSAIFDLALHLSEVRDGLAGRIEYSTDLFDAATVGRLARHVVTLLEAIAEDADRSLSALPLLAPAEVHHLVSGCNASAAPYPTDRPWHALVEAHGDRAPEATAAEFGEALLTYGELERRANRLANHLRALGVGPGALVAVCLERSPELLVTIIGILKAGGAFLPLDPAYPPARLAFMVQDARPAAIVTERRLVESLGDAGERLVLVDADAAAIARRPAARPRATAGLDDLAYAIYTSGSTGQPKCALLEHRGLCNLAQAQLDTFGFTPSSRVLQFSSLSFDAFVFELVMALSAGAALVLASREELMPGPGLVQLVRLRGVTAMLLPPSAMSAVPPAALPSLETLMVAGEPCTAELVDRWTAGRRFFNLYGPTETTIWATFAECSAGQGRPSIGRPVANVRCHVLDAAGNLVPLGVRGELCIGGAGVGRGYLRRPQLTAERFVPDPFGPGRLYRTGDVVRRRADGSLDFLGRLDHQVKVRGFRIELGEVEAALRDQPGVRDAVVVAREDERGGRRLVAYVVPDGAADDLPGGLGRGLRRRLPDFMVPSAFVVLDELPVTGSGKLDVAALPPPHGGRPAVATAFAPPQGPLEEALVGIWRDVLRVDRVGLHDDFFELGGHSLLATQLIARLNDAFAVELPLRALFEGATVAELALAVEEALVRQIEALPEDEAQRLAEGAR
jgi:amino acid adenylation domain-containing protein